MFFFITILIIGGIVIAVKSNSNNSNTTSKTESSSTLNYNVISDTPHPTYQRPDVKEDKKTLPKELIKSVLANPPHKGFDQLATIEYKRGNYEEVIKLCKQAKKLKFSGGWDYIIEKAQKKMGK